MKATIEFTKSIEHGIPDIQGIIKEIKKDKLLKGLKVLKIKFLETDSNNPSHGSAYYDVTIEGPVDKVLEVLCEYAYDREAAEDLLVEQKIPITGRILKKMRSMIWDT